MWRVADTEGCSCDVPICAWPAWASQEATPLWLGGCCNAVTATARRAVVHGAELFARCARLHANLLSRRHRPTYMAALACRSQTQTQTHASTCSIITHADANMCVHRPCCHASGGPSQPTGHRQQGTGVYPHTVSVPRSSESKITQYSTSPRGTAPSLAQQPLERQAPRSTWVTYIGSRGMLPVPPAYYVGGSKMPLASARALTTGARWAAAGPRAALAPRCPPLV